MKKKKIVALCGSTRMTSTNLSLIKAIQELVIDFADITIFKELTNLPHFNPDFDNGNSPQAVEDFRKQLRLADGILICTPEYAMGVPGTLKNAIDWTVSSMEFSHKPTVLITASSLGEKSHDSLLGTLKIIEAKVTDETNLLIPYASTKINKEAKIIDAETAVNINNLIVAFQHLLLV